MFVHQAKKLSTVAALTLCIQIIAAVPTDATNLTAQGVGEVWCTTDPGWTEPNWPSTVHVACERLLYLLETSQPEIASEPEKHHEFLPVGQQPRFPWAGPAVRTPWKMTLVTVTHAEIVVTGDCTLAVTTLKSVARGALPAPDFQPGDVLPVSGTASWFEIWRNARIALRKCVKRKNAGMQWDDTNKALGVFFYASRSVIDTKIGPRVNNDLVLVGSNVTQVNVS